jgi:hypothetical protein
MWRGVRRGVTPQERFASQAEARYGLEPYIRPFAKFAEGSGEDVLEVGVGWALIIWSGLGAPRAGWPALTLRLAQSCGPRTGSMLMGSHRICERRTPSICRLLTTHLAWFTRGVSCTTRLTPPAPSARRTACSGQAASSVS